MASVFLLDSEPFSRDGIKEYLQNTSGHTVVGEEVSGLNAIPMILAERPELLITELHLHELDGLEVVRRIHDQLPSTQIIVNTHNIDSINVSRSIRYGARGYIVKSSCRGDLSQAIQSVLNGKTFFSSSISHFVDQEGHSVDVYEDLTTREREVLQLVAEGNTASEITEKLFISVRTVEKHRSNLMKKLQIHSHNDLIRYALQRGLIPFQLTDGDLAT